MKKLQRLVKALIGFIGLTFLVGFFHYYTKNSVNISTERASGNYFLESWQYRNMGFIIETPTCQIPNIELYHSSISSLIKPPNNYACEKNRRWSYVEGQKLYLNATKMEEDGHPLHLLSCCYKSIERVEQDTEIYDDEIDNVVKFNKCTSMYEVNEPIDEYLVVVCKPKYFFNEFENIYLYKYFHAIAQPHKSFNTRKKIKYWKKFDKNNNGNASDLMPPNVIIVGMDSTSRLNFNRQMPLTNQILQELKAVDMLGHTKVGYNTFPCSVPYFSGYSDEEIRKVCMYTEKTKQDLCPYIWKRFDEANYLTAHVEDSPLLMAFSNFKIGFVQQPTDYYLRTFMLAVYKNEGNYPLVIDCIGNQTVDEVVLLYMEHLLHMSQRSKIPIFLSSWLTNAAHESWNQINQVDHVYANFFKQLIEKDLLQNSVLFIMGDHGYNYGPFRETFSGWYESKLPNMKVVISQDLRTKFPSWMQSLSINSRRLTSSYDIYWTMSDILDTFTTTNTAPNAYDQNSNLVSRKYGQSFFKEIPIDRSCEHAGIPDSYCACSLPVKIALDTPVLKSGAHFTINYINHNLIDLNVCAPLILGKILGGSMQTISTSTTATIGYIITFTTAPGDFLFETDIYYSEQTKKFQFPSSPNIQRMSKFSTDVSCVTNATQQLYCFCL